jgi:hypothetical protein
VREGGVPRQHPACDLEGPFPKPIVESDTDRPVPTAGEALAETVSYFFLPNPDGHKVGQKSDPVELRGGEPEHELHPGVSFARGNGNGVDLNRDWPAVGYTQRSHQPWSEPETRAFGEVLLDIRDQTANGAFAGGIDLHGMTTARAFSYTLLGADQRDYRKNAVTVDTSLRTYEDQTARLTWSPYIGDSTGDGEQDRPGVVPVADEWGTIYDTLGYTITGGLGNWMDDSRLGLGGVGINNEMALSNLAPNTIYEPALVQTHIDGNKGLIYSQIASLMYEDRSIASSAPAVASATSSTRAADGRRAIPERRTRVCPPSRRSTCCCPCQDDRPAAEPRRWLRAKGDVRDERHGVDLRVRGEGPEDRRVERRHDRHLDSPRTEHGATSGRSMPGCASSAGTTCTPTAASGSWRRTCRAPR